MKMRRLIPAIAMLLVSAVMLSTATFAWFTTSNQADVNGMSVTAVAGSTLLIVNAKDATLTTGSFANANGILELDEVPTKLIPSTSDNGTMKILANPEAVDPATGLPVGTDKQGLTATGVTEEANYYYDYVVAIASAGVAVSGDLQVTIGADVQDYLHNAVSIDFLVGATEADAEYVTKIHFADMTNDEITAQLGAQTIPLTTDETVGYIIVVMRVYFDGALINNKEGGDGKAYVRNTNMSAAGIPFSATFLVNNATEIETPVETPTEAPTEAPTEEPTEDPQG